VTPDGWRKIDRGLFESSDGECASQTPGSSRPSCDTAGSSRSAAAVDQVGPSTTATTPPCTTHAPTSKPPTRRDLTAPIDELMVSVLAYVACTHRSCSRCSETISTSGRSSCAARTSTTATGAARSTSPTRRRSVSLRACRTTCAARSCRCWRGRVRRCSRSLVRRATRWPSASATTPGSSRTTTPPGARARRPLSAPLVNLVCAECAPSPASTPAEPKKRPAPGWTGSPRRCMAAGPSRRRARPRPHLPPVSLPPSAWEPMSAGGRSGLHDTVTAQMSPWEARSCRRSLAMKTNVSAARQQQIRRSAPSRRSQRTAARIG
jgi:hypothetical protein